MTTADIRSDLERTGVLVTGREDDLGHIPGFWREAILGLCAALDAAPTGAAALLQQERLARASTKAELTKTLADLEATKQRAALSDNAKDNAVEASRRASQLVAEAVPRMRTLNNAMSPGWLARAATLLGE